jgi:hypothetical protein
MEDNNIMKCVPQHPRTISEDAVDAGCSIDGAH